MEKEFVPTNHLTATTTSDWIVAIMGGYFFNSARCDLPTRRLRIYFNFFDSFELRDDAVNPDGHIANITNFDNPSARGCIQGWDRLGHRNLIGFQIRDLDSFVWHCQFRGTRVEIHATRVGDSDEWSVVYKSDSPNAVDGENSAVLASWFQMINPDTLEIHKLTAVAAVTNAAGVASQMACNDAICRGNHPQMYFQLKQAAEERGVDVSGCFGSSCVLSSVPERAQLQRWWLLVMELPIEEEVPSYRDCNAYHAWKLRHVDVMFAVYGSDLPRNFRGHSCFASEQEIIDELVTIGATVHVELGEPPAFSFKGYLYGVNWTPATSDKTRTDRVLTAASERLGWQMT